MLAQSTQTYFRKKIGRFKYVWQPVFKPSTILPNNLSSFFSMLTLEFIDGLWDNYEQGPTLTGTSVSK